jgi:epoxyqueuosine reductase
MDPALVTRAIADAARAVGFHRVGVAGVAPLERHAVFEAWVAAGHAGTMTYLTDAASRAARRDVRSVLPEARSLVSVALSYAQPSRPDPPGTASIARYARGADYHMIMKGKLAELATRVGAVTGGAVAARPCVDTAPVLERDLAERAGIGFAGKNTMIIAPGLGSYILLGELLLGIDAEPLGAGAPDRKRCGECRLCLDACPTRAFTAEHALDARLCISYLTIENAGAIPRDLRPLMGRMIFGCDVCQEICPFNGADRGGGAPELRPRRSPPELLALLGLGAAQFRRFVKRSALRRIHRAQLLRNVCVALGNAGDKAAIPALRAALSVEPALVRVHAAWALGRLGDLAHLAAQRALETDEEVRAEIDLTIADARGL